MAEAAGKHRPAIKVDLTVLGDASCGKSTLVGHLLHSCGEVDEQALALLEKATPLVGSQVLNYALLMDPTFGRRARGTAAIEGVEGGPLQHLKSMSYRFAISEVPGDQEMLKGMAASSFSGHADVAVLVVSAAPGELERGLSPEGHTREHALLARVLGAQRLIVAVTKMDAPANAYSQARYGEAKSALTEMLQKVGFAAGEASFIPVSGLLGENLTEPSPQMAWHKGPTLLQALEALPPPARPLATTLRVSVREVYHLDSVGAVAAGYVEQGTLRLGAQVQFAPGGATGRVKVLEVEKEAVREAYPQDLVSFVIEGLGVQDLRQGMVASEVARPCAGTDLQTFLAQAAVATEVETFLAQVAVLRGPGEVRPGFSPVLACHATQAPCRVEQLVARLDRRTGQVLEEQPEVLRAGDVGLVWFRPEQPLCVEAHSTCPRLGQFATAPSQTAIALVGTVREIRPMPPGGGRNWPTTGF